MSQSARIERRRLLGLLAGLPLALGASAARGLGPRSMLRLVQLLYPGGNPQPRPSGLKRLAWEIGFQVEDDLAKALKGKTVYIVGADPVSDDQKLAKALDHEFGRYLAGRSTS